MAAPTLVGPGGGTAVEYATGAEQRYYDFTLPAGTAAGDVFVFNLTTSSTVTTEVTYPAGTVVIMPMGGIGVGVSGGVYWWKVPAVVPVSVRFDWVTPRRGSLVYIHARGANLNLYQSDINDWLTAETAAHKIPSVDIAGVDVLLVTGFMIGSGSAAITAPGSWVSRTDPAQREGRMGTQVFTGPGASPRGDWTTGGAYQSRSWTVAIVDGDAPEPIVTQDVMATVQTEYMPAGFSDDIADTPAIWVDTDQPSRSVVLGSRKAPTGGGIDVYDLTGKRLSFYGVGEVNNVMLRDLRGKLGWGDRILVIGTNRTNNTLAVAWLDRQDRTLSAAGSVPVGFEPYGCALYISPVDGAVYAFVSEATGGAGGLKQYRLDISGSTVTGTQVRSMPTATLSEGMACDDATQTFFLTEEGAGFYKYGAEPSAGTSRTTIDIVGGGHLEADVEGVAIAYGRTPGDDKIIVSSQGNSTFVVYNLAPPHAFVKAFRIVGDGGSIDDVTDTDGIAVTRLDLGPAWPDGLFVAHDTTNPSSPASNFKYIDIGEVLGSYRTPPVALVGATTAGLTGPTGRWVKGTMHPIWRDQAGVWKAIVPTATGHRFYTLAPGGNTQGAVVDASQAARVTAVHAAGTTYVLRVAGTAGTFCRYDAAYAKIGADVALTMTGITDIDAQPVSLLRSPNGHLWVAWTGTNAIRVARSTDNGATWTTQSVVTQTGVAGPVGLAMSGTTLVLMATDNNGLGRWVRTISQAAASHAAASWATEAMAALPSPLVGDDHLGIVGLPDGRILLASKTTNSTTATQAVLYTAVRSAGGVWTTQLLEGGPDEQPPSYTRPSLTVVGNQVRVVYGSIYGHRDLSTRTCPIDSLGSWSERGVMLVGPHYGDGAVLPTPESLAGLTSGSWPVLAHNRDTQQILVHWEPLGAAGGSISGFLDGVPIAGAFLDGAAVGAIYLGELQLV